MGIMWWVYLVLCNDGSLYCGTSSDPDRRLTQHNKGKGAKYTRARRPVNLVWFSEGFKRKGDALSLEYLIKTLTRKQKWKLIKGEIRYEIQTNE